MTDPSSTLATRRQRYGLLLGAIILAFAIQGIAEPGKAEQIIVAVLLGVTLLLALWAAEAKPRVMRPAALLVAAVIIASIVETANGGIGGGATRIANALLVALAPPAIIVGVVRSLRARQTVTPEAVFGEIRGAVGGYDLSMAALATGGAAQSMPVSGRIPGIPVDGRPELQENREAGEYVSEITLPPFLLGPGVYQVSVACGVPNLRLIDDQNGPYFEISGVGTYAARWSGGRQGVLLSVQLDWRTRRAAAQA